MLLVLKRTVSMRRFFWAPKTCVKIDGYENIYSFTLKIFVYLNLWLKSLERPTCNSYEDTDTKTYKEDDKHQYKLSLVQSIETHLYRPEKERKTRQ